MSVRTSLRSESALLSGALAGLAGLCVIAAVGCSDSPASPPPFGGNPPPLGLRCDAASATALVGSASVPVTATLTRGATGVSSETVQFSSTRGPIVPSTGVTDRDGQATSFFQVPATPGLATVTATVQSRTDGETVTTQCLINVISPRDPQLTVSVVSPPQLAGLSIRVFYEPTRVTLPATAVEARGGFASSSCVSQAADDDIGSVLLNIGCSQLLSSTGAAARFSFQHVSGAESDAGDFTAQCSGVDENGRAVATLCSTSVIQL